MAFVKIARDGAYHSINKEDPNVYHRYDDCPAGEQILTKNRRVGSNGRVMCDRCIFRR